MSLTTNLVSYWKLDESSGNASDSVGSNTLTNNNSVTYSSGKINNGAVFVRASSKSLSVTDNASLSLTGDLTISAWVNFASTPSSGNYFGIVAKLEGSPNYSYAFYLYNNAGTPEITFQNSTNGTSVTQKGVAWTPTTSTWYHIAAVYTASAGSVSFYINGSQQGTTQTGLGTSIFDSSSTFYIGRYDGGNYFDGSVDEVGMWSRVLTSGEITSLYNGGVGFTYPFVQTLLAGVGSFSLTGYDAGIGRVITLVASVGSFLLTGFNALLSLTGTHWTNESKNSATFTNQSKNTATFTNQSKNSATWTNENKH